jgi:hypothetical protein
MRRTVAIFRRIVRYPPNFIVLCDPITTDAEELVLVRDNDIVRPTAKTVECRDLFVHVRTRHCHRVDDIFSNTPATSFHERRDRVRFSNAHVRRHDHALQFKFHLPSLLDFWNIVREIKEDGVLHYRSREVLSIIHGIFLVGRLVGRPVDRNNCLRRHYRREITRHPKHNLAPGRNFIRRYEAAIDDALEARNSMPRSNRGKIWGQKRAVFDVSLRWLVVVKKARVIHDNFRALFGSGRLQKRSQATLSCEPCKALVLRAADLHVHP